MSLLRFLPLFALLAALAGCEGTYKPSPWLTHVPAAERARVSPLVQSGANIHTGAQIYELSCQRCHGLAGRGSHARPSLRSARVHAETDGEIHWILVHGGRGMPAWKGLGDDGLWQLIEYIRSLPAQPGT